MTNNERWIAYLDAITDGATGLAISEATGISRSSISRWLNGNAEPDARQVVTVARAYGVSPVAALKAAGYLTDSDIEAPSDLPRKLQLREFSDLELSLEMVRRVEDRGSEILEAPLDGNHPAMQLRGNVSRLEDAPSTKKREASRTAADQDKAVAKPKKTVIDIDEFD